MNIFVGFFSHPEIGSFSVETNLTGDPNLDNAKLWDGVHKLHPTRLREEFTRDSTAIESRDAALLTVEYPVGATIKSLFGDNPDENGIPIGKVMFSGEPCEILLRYHRGRNSAGITLRERATGIPIRFNEPIAGMRLVRELPDLIRGIVSQSGRDYAFTLVETRQSK